MKREDLTGRQFGELTAIEYLGYKTWLCKCSCGEECEVATYRLTSGQVTHCNNNPIHRLKENLTGKTFGNWKVLGYLGNGKWDCECMCEKHTRRELFTNTLVTGKSKSCGCQVNHEELLKDKPGDVYGEWTLIEPLHNGKWLCRCSCGNTKAVNTNQLHAGQSLSCGHSKYEAKIDYKDKQIGDYKVLEYIGNRTWKCQCLKCGETKEITQAHLKNEEGIRCSKITYRENLVGKEFGRWKVIEYTGNGNWLCECSCEKHTRKELSTHVLKSGGSKSCGCLIKDVVRETQLNDISGQLFGNWKALEYVGDRKWKCENIKSGEIREIAGYSLTSGATKGLENSYNINIGDTFGRWTVIDFGDSEHQFKLKCQCGCANKTIRYVTSTALVSGASKSCGCMQGNARKKTLLERYGEIATNKVNNPRNSWQIETVSSKEKLEEYIKSLNERDRNINYICKYLGIRDGSVLKYLKKYNLTDLIYTSTNRSSLEDSVVSSIREYYAGNIIINDRCILNPYEIDIYLPEKKLGIEVDGTYWHCSIFKDRRYHLEKTLEASKKGIRLIHIFEYEMDNDKLKSNILDYIKYSIIGPSNIVYARNTRVEFINKNEAVDFLNENHLQGYSESEVHIGCYYNNTLIGVMTFGKPRFGNKDIEYELIRASWKRGYGVVGGTNKLFKFFVDSKFNPRSILSYCNLAKFTGNSYEMLGFKEIDISEPNYVWVKDSKVLPRYKTTKRDLLDAGLGTDDDTEDSIMDRLGFLKVYDCGNKKFVWTRG